MSESKQQISALEVREVTKPFLVKKRLAPILIFLVDIIVFLVLLSLILFVESYYIKFALALVCGLAIGLLFIVGHDCCHQSFTRNKTINGILGRLAFLPSLHNFSLWELGHNQTHHAFTNLREHDYVYEPLSPQEYESLNSYKKAIYQIYRSTLGHGLYYGVEIWFKKIFFPNSSIPSLSKKQSHWLDVLPLSIYLVNLIFIIYLWSNLTNQSFIANLVFAFVLPFVTWNWLIGFVIYQHHTTPLNNWYKDKEEWYYMETQFVESTHIKFPKPLNFILHNIMEHTAHHVNMGIPLYNLSKAQNAIENRFSSRVKVINWTWSFYRNSIKTCKLYNYETHQWVGF